MHCTEELSTIHWLWLTNSTATQLSSVRSRIIRCCSAFGFVLTEANISSPRWWHWLAIYPIQDQSAVSTTAAVRSALTKERVSSKSFPKFSTNTHARTVPVTFSLSLTPLMVLLGWLQIVAHFPMWPRTQKAQLVNKQPQFPLPVRAMTMRGASSSSPRTESSPGMILWMEVYEGELCTWVEGCKMSSLNVRENVNVCGWPIAGSLILMRTRTIWWFGFNSVCAKGRLQARIYSNHEGSRCVTGRWNEWTMMMMTKQVISMDTLWRGGGDGGEGYLARKDSWSGEV